MSGPGSGSSPLTSTAKLFRKMSEKRPSDPLREPPAMSGCRNSSRRPERLLSVPMSGKSSSWVTSWNSAAAAWETSGNPPAESTGDAPVIDGSSIRNVTGTRSVLMFGVAGGSDGVTIFASNVSGSVGLGVAGKVVASVAVTARGLVLRDWDSAKQTRLIAVLYFALCNNMAPNCFSFTVYPFCQFSFIYHRLID